MTSLQGTLIVKHPVHDGITNEDILPALPEEARRGDRHVIEVDVRAAALQAIETGDWHDVGREQARIFREKLKPEMDARPGFRLAYFGTAPIPLAIQLGYLTSTWTTIDTYIRHHERHDWNWLEFHTEEPALRVRGMPEEVVRAEGDAIIRVSTTIEVDPRDSLTIVPEPLAEVDITLDAPGLDAVVSMSLLDRVAEAFRHALDAIARFRPNAKGIHVFAAVPVGLAFRMGTRISPTIHPRVMTYQFNRTASPRYQAAIAVQDEFRPRPALSDEDRALAAADRASIGGESERLQALAAEYKEWADGRQSASWIDFVLPDQEARAALQQPPWTKLLPIASTPLSSASVDMSTTTVDDSFRFDRTKRAWQLGDDLIVAIRARFSSEEERLRAARMLLLHEGIHARHRLTGPTGVQVGLFPKLVEEVDYQADVWGMLHEYCLARKERRDRVPDARAFFLQLIWTATETTWAFDAGSSPLYEIQIRRLNRYLIWYWQYLRMETAQNLAEIARILADRPLLELAGPRTILRGSRVYYQVDPRHVQGLELAVLHDNAIIRLGSSLSLPLHELLNGIRSRNGDLIREVLRGAFDQLHEHR